MDHYRHREYYFSKFNRSTWTSACTRRDCTRTEARPWFSFVPSFCCDPILEGKFRDSLQFGVAADSSIASCSARFRNLADDGQSASTRIVSDFVKFVQAWQLSFSTSRKLQMNRVKWFSLGHQHVLWIFNNRWWFEKICLWVIVMFCDTSWLNFEQSMNQAEKFANLLNVFSTIQPKVYLISKLINHGNSSIFIVTWYQQSF